MDIRQSELWAQYLEKLGWKSEAITSEYFAYIKKIPFFGTTIKIPRAPLPIPFREIDSLAQKNNASFIKLEPLVETGDNNSEKILELLKNSRFEKDNWSLNPTKTIQIDLTKSEEELLSAMEKDTRYCIRLAVKSGVQVKETNDLEEFKKIYFETANRKKFWPAKKELEVLWEVFSKENAAAILTAFYNNQPLASTLLLYITKPVLGAAATQDGRVPKLLERSANEFRYAASYYHAASLHIHREVMGPYLLLWEAMRYLKTKGIKTLDLEGVHDHRIKSTKGWKGFSLFKKGFGGREVEYLGAFVKYYNPWIKVLFFMNKFF